MVNQGQALALVTSVKVEAAAEVPALVATAATVVTRPIMEPGVVAGVVRKQNPATRMAYGQGLAAMARPALSLLQPGFEVSMQYQAIPDDPHAVVWMDDNGSGVAREGDPLWADYQCFLAKGGKAVPLGPTSIELSVAMSMVSGEVERVGAELRAGYTQYESDSWYVQATEAAAWLADSSTLTPWIDAVSLPDEDKTQLCQHIVARNQAYTEAMGELIMWRRTATAAIEACFSTGQPITALTVHYPEVPHAS